MLRGYSFHPRGWRLALAAAGCAAGILLGQWQSRRADEKLALERKLDASLQQPPIVIPPTPVQAGELLQKRVAASGAFIADRTVLLDNRNRGGQPGYEVVTPLWLSPSMAVLVQRGWVARDRRDTLRTPPGVQRVDGLALARLPKALTPPGTAESGPVRQNLDIEAYAKEIGVALQPIVIQQRNDDGDGLVRDWPRPDFGRDMNRAYALQWYALAALAAVLGVAFSFRRVRES